MSGNPQTGKQLWIIGLGHGSRRLVTRQEAAALKYTELFIGTKNALSFAEAYTRAEGVRTVTARQGEAIRRAILEAREERIAVVMEGDPCTSGELDAIWPMVRDLKPVLFPGISQSAYIAAKAGMSCAGAPYVDLRYGQTNLAELCRRHQKLVVRTGKDVRPVMRGLAAAGFGKMVACVLENPGRDTEKLSTGNVRELTERPIASDALLLLVRGRGVEGEGPGIRDEAFAGTKSVLPQEVRAVLMSRLGIRAEETVYVLGCSQGDVVVEAASAAYAGLVYAVDENPEACARTLENCRRFGSRNVRVIEGRVPAALAHIEPPDAAVLRGLGADTGAVMQILLSRNPEVRLAVVTDSPETAVEAVGQLKDRQLESEMLQLCGLRSKKNGERHALSGQWSKCIVTSLRT